MLSWSQFDKLLFIWLKSSRQKKNYGQLSHVEGRRNCSPWGGGPWHFGLPACFSMLLKPESLGVGIIVSSSSWLPNLTGLEGASFSPKFRALTQKSRFHMSRGWIWDTPAVHSPVYWCGEYGVQFSAKKKPKPKITKGVVKQQAFSRDLKCANIF